MENKAKTNQIKKGCVMNPHKHIFVDLGIECLHKDLDLNSIYLK